MKLNYYGVASNAKLMSNDNSGCNEPCSICSTALNTLKVEIVSLVFSFHLAGMMIETMAGKSACLNGVVYDATPFTYSEDDPAVNYFGNLLKQCNCDI